MRQVFSAHLISAARFGLTGVASTPQRLHWNGLATPGSLGTGTSLASSNLPGSFPL